MSDAGKSGYRIAVVDDAPILRRILVALLEKENHQVVSFESGAAFLADKQAFDLVMLDIDMPDMNGYDVCRRLRQRDEGGNVPVIFVSGHDTAPERIEAYQAGGNDFIVKPVAADEVRYKVDFVLNQQSERHQLTSRSQAASEVAFTAMTTMGELGTVLDFMRRSGNCIDPAAVATALLEALTPLGLSGAVQVRTRSGKQNFASQGQASPLQDSVMDSLCSMGRLFVFGSRGIVNYDHVSLLAVNLPTNDEGRLGRLRDHLALLAEGADSRLSAIAATQTIIAMHSEATNTLAELHNTLGQTSLRALNARQHAQSKTLETLDSLRRMIESYSITDMQRETIQHTIQDTMDDLLSIYDEAAIADDDFARIVTRLERLADKPATVTG